MANHKTVSLTTEEREIALDTIERVALAQASGKRAEVSYIKRDGSTGSLVGRPLEVIGIESTQAVRWETERGFRMTNTYAITSWHWTK